MDSQIKLDFNRRPSSIMHIDLNSCFASVEQQANPLLRYKPVAVAAYDTPNGCILAASIEAKRLGIKVGLRVKEGRLLCPNLIVRSPDSDKYRSVHLASKKSSMITLLELSPNPSMSLFSISLEPLVFKEECLTLAVRSRIVSKKK